MIKTQSKTRKFMSVCVYLQPACMAINVRAVKEFYSLRLATHR